MLMASSTTVSSIPFTSNFQEVADALISSQVKSPFPDTTLTLAVFNGSKSMLPVQCIPLPAIQPMPFVFRVLVDDNFWVQVLPPLVEKNTKSPHVAPNWLLLQAFSVETIILFAFNGSTLTPP